jgi:acetylglutamate kinase
MATDVSSPLYLTYLKDSLIDLFTIEELKELCFELGTDYEVFKTDELLNDHIKFAELEQALSFAEGRMKKKVLGASEAIAAGVTQVVFGDARTARPIFNAMNGQGTVIER